MTHLAVICMLVASLSAVMAVPDFDKYILYFNTSLSQTCIGSYYHPTATDYTYKQYAEWIMDFQNNQLRFTIGTADEGNHLQLMALESTSYVLERTNSSDPTTDLHCFEVQTANFAAVMGAYLYPFMRYLTDAWVNGQVYRVYGGVSPDPLTGTNIPNLAYVNSENRAFVLNTMLSTDGYFYYAFSNVTLGVPLAALYTPSTVCNYAEPTCTPACVANAKCVNGACACVNGYTGNGTVSCTALSRTADVGSINITYDEFVLNSTGDAVSQTCIGTYGEPANGVSMFSRWAQDLENNRIRWDIGNPNDNGSVSYFYMNDAGYTVTNVNGAYVCNSTNQMTFAQAMDNMFYPTVRFVTLGSYSGLMHRMYIGMNQIKPGGSSVGIVKYITVSDKKFKLMAELTSAGYNYYDYPNVVLGTPRDDLFNISSICNIDKIPTTTPDGAGALQVNGLLTLALMALSTMALRFTL